MGLYTNIVVDGSAVFIGWHDGTNITCHLSYSKNGTGGEEWEAAQLVGSGGENLSMDLNIIGNLSPFNIYQGFFLHRKRFHDNL